MPELRAKITQVKKTGLENLLNGPPALHREAYDNKSYDDKAYEL